MRSLGRSGRLSTSRKQLRTFCQLRSDNGAAAAALLAADLATTPHQRDHLRPVAVGMTRRRRGGFADDALDFGAPFSKDFAFLGSKIMPLVNPHDAGAGANVAEHRFDHLRRNLEALALQPGRHRTPQIMEAPRRQGFSVFDPGDLFVEQPLGLRPAGDVGRAGCREHKITFADVVQRLHQLERRGRQRDGMRLTVFGAGAGEFDFIADDFRPAQAADLVAAGAGENEQPEDRTERPSGRRYRTPRPRLSPR